MNSKVEPRNFAKVFITFLSVVLLLSSCVPSDGNRSRLGLKTEGSTNTGGGGPSSGPGSLPTTPGLGSEDDGALQTLKVELSHLVDPFTGTYKKKVTIPKNFRGEFYIAGINVAALQDKLVKVRFYMGHDAQPVTLDATVARAPGIIPQTDIQVLSVNMRNAPFQSHRLNYDLYDYNDYNDTDITNQESLNGSLSAITPVADNRNSGLYCRGLDLKYDPTFSGTSVSGGCLANEDKCLYAYAKVVDQTLYPAAGVTTNVVSLPQVWKNTNGVRSPSLLQSANGMCLPDKFDSFAFNATFETSITLAQGLITSIGGNNFIYKGPYRSTNLALWKIGGNAIYNGEFGLFKKNDNLGLQSGYESLMFPRSGKMSLQSSISYTGGSTYFGDRSSQTVDSTGSTMYVDGCNIRAQNYNAATNEGIGSCNVNAYVEVFYVKDGAEILITKDHTLKVQLVRASQTNYEGKEVLASSFKSCENSTSCGGEECCYNKRCWSKDLVSMCVDQVTTVGNKPVGTTCGSDYECSSLCCNQSTGACSPHDPNGLAPVLCSKTSGQSCVTKEFCQPHYVPTCKVVKLPGLGPNGKVQCALRCPAVETYGSCTNGVCIPPETPEVPTFDPNDCSNAVDP